MSKKGILLLNLGTPEAPTPEKVKPYLQEFLMDPFVVDIPTPFRFLLLQYLFAKGRPKQSAHAYQKIWTERGSPLMFHTQDLTQKVRALIADTHVVRFAMRYGQPSVATVLSEFAGDDISELCVIPLYPQYALASTESCIQKVLEETKGMGFKTPIRFVKDFYDFSPFIDAVVNAAEPTLKSYNYDHVLFTFHGIPERHIKKIDSAGNHCLQKNNCCEQMSDANRNCYRAQSYATARALAAKLGLATHQYTVSFQSRLGRTPWIKPYTDEVLKDLAQKGIKRLAVFEPSFVADCLETLEELGIRGREDFIAAGGQDLQLVPCVNSSDAWAHAVVELSKPLS